jgi:hypothetical protein
MSKVRALKQGVKGQSSVTGAKRALKQGSKVRALKQGLKVRYLKQTVTSEGSERRVKDHGPRVKGQGSETGEKLRALKQGVKDQGSETGGQRSEL